MLDINGIMEIIPQRPPFLMIDRVEENVQEKVALHIKMYV